MIGDVNLFLKGSPGEDDEFEVEVEIMIAGELRPLTLSLWKMIPNIAATITSVHDRQNPSSAGED